MLELKDNEKNISDIICLLNVHNWLHKRMKKQNQREKHRHV